jgi:hypothetical protein
LQILLGLLLFARSTLTSVCGFERSGYAIDIALEQRRYLCPREVSYSGCIGPNC